MHPKCLIVFIAVLCCLYNVEDAHVLPRAINVFEDGKLSEYGSGSGSGSESGSGSGE